MRKELGPSLPSAWADRMRLLGIRLLKGDGHILFTECGGGANLVEVWSRTKNTPFCFKITAAKGYLSMDLARVYLIKGDDHALKATMKIKDENDEDQG